MKLLVILYSDFNDMELVTTLSVIEKAQQNVHFEYINPPSNKDGKSFTAVGQHGIVEKLIYSDGGDVQIDEYDAVFIPGGKQAKILRQDLAGQELIKKFYDAKKYVFAICDAPNALKDSQIIQEQNYSSYPIDRLKAGVNRNDKLATVDGKLITGKSPYSAYWFGLTIVKTLFGEKIASQVDLALHGNYND